MPLAIAAADRLVSARLTAFEPEFVWVAPVAKARVRADAAPALTPDKALAFQVRRNTRRATLVVPAATAAALVALAAALVVSRRLGTRERSRRLVVLGGLAAATLLGAVARVEVPLDFGPRYDAPPDEEALGVFRALHRNIYRAFDCRTESDVYDVLAQSVDGELLESIYIEVRTSMVLADMGHASCRIEDVQVLDCALGDPTGALALADGAFAVRCRWRVRGALRHWGHAHLRTNDYEAVYAVEPRDDLWKIAAVQVLQQRSETALQRTEAPKVWN
jgi:hypothetical protein